MLFLKNFKYYAIYLVFGIAYFVWVVWTYDNVVFMDILNIIGGKVKNLYEHNLSWHDFLYKPFFPCFFSLCYTFFTAQFLHLNTFYQAILGALVLIFIGLYYLKIYFPHLKTHSEKIYFSLLIGFFTFGLHKWEGSLDCFGALIFPVLLLLFIVSYKSIVCYTEATNFVLNKRKYYWFFIIASFCISLEYSSYYIPFNFVIITVLLVTRFMNLYSINKQRWNYLLYTNIILLIWTLALNVFMSHSVYFKDVAGGYNLSDFFVFLRDKPLWLIQYYFLGHTGPFIGKPLNFMTTLRVFIGVGILMMYIFAIYYVIKTKNKKLIIPMAMVIYNIFAIGFITLSRYQFNMIDGAASSRYSFLGLQGVLGFVTILFFYLKESNIERNKNFVKFFLIIIIVCYAAVDYWQAAYKSLDRKKEHQIIKACILDNKYHLFFQADSLTVMKAIPVLHKYRLNVCYNEDQLN